MNESLLSILPHCLLKLTSSILTDLVMKLQINCHDGGSAGNSPSQALELLRGCQKSLENHIHHEISPEEQLYYVYMINELNKSLVEYQSSLEQLQSSHDVAMLVSILLNIGHSFLESRSGHQAVSHNVFSLLISTVSFSDL